MGVVDVNNAVRKVSATIDALQGRATIPVWSRARLPPAGDVAHTITSLMSIHLNSQISLRLYIMRGIVRCYKPLSATLL